MILCISVFVVISPFSFLILLIWFLSLCFLMSLANNLSILFIFSKNQPLALLIFAMVSFVSFQFIYVLIFMISFLLLTLRFFISSFSMFHFLVALGVELGYFFDVFLISWRKPALLWTFPLHCFYSVPIGVVLLCFHFHSFLWIFWFCFLFLLWFVGYSQTCCSAFIWWDF